MHPKTNPISFALRTCILLSVLTLCAACTSMGGKDEPSDTNRLFAEYSLMKKRLPLVERENDVLKKENLQYRTKIWDQRNKIEKLGRNLTSVSESYTKDKAAAEDRIRTLRRDMETIQKEDMARIDTLTAINTAVKESMTRKVRMLGKQIEAQKAAFSQERKQLVQINAQSELKLTGRINDLNKTIEANVLKISSLRIALSEISTRLGEATARADALQKARDEYVTELEAMKESDAELQKNIDAAKATNTHLQKGVDAAKATIAHLQKEIDTVKATNAQLQKRNDYAKATIAQLQKKIGTAKATNTDLQKKNDALTDELLKPDSRPEKNN